VRQPRAPAGGCCTDLFCSSTFLWYTQSAHGHTLTDSNVLPNSIFRDRWSNQTGLRCAAPPQPVALTAMVCDSDKSAAAPPITGYRCATPVRPVPLTSAVDPLCHPSARWHSPRSSTYTGCALPCRIVLPFSIQSFSIHFVYSLPCSPRPGYRAGMCTRQAHLFRSTRWCLSSVAKDFWAEHALG